MSETISTTEPANSYVLEYRLTEAAARHYATSGPVKACRQLCRNQGWGLLLVLAIGLFLFDLVYQSHGAQSVGLMLVVLLIVLVALGWLRRARYCRKECRLARDMGVPLDIH